MALRIEKVFCVKMETLLRMQACYDAYHMRLREEEIHFEQWLARLNSDHH